jgi:N-acetylglucosaminyldiphosphoundecaprenol N-acetyl-beta-D-mannosaminyltransferase
MRAAGHRHPHAAPAVRVGGVAIHPVPPANVPSAIEGFIDCGRSHVVHFVPADPIATARRDAGYRAVLNAGDLNLPDGMSVVWALRLAGVRARRTPGSDTMTSLAAWSAGSGARHYFYGGAPGVSDRLAERLTRTNPGMRVAGCESPPFGAFGDEEVAAAAGRMRAARADIAWIGLGAPKQDVVADGLRRHRAAPVIMCVGAAFDFVSGAKRRPPTWMQHAGLEWAGRLALEPRRLWKRYLVGNARFAAALVQEWPRRPDPSDAPYADTSGGSA